VALITWLT